ncbi:hypothetical protein TIFTF001_021149 [Ficus carica]|uniref:Uncharacterized protein n=1 Tax=Ficus carica TaxID=3494 RepID=A0AA88DEA6_FICCA|nr:hypothetical protein TIFTF001_021149 [Ficus carica]
MRFQKKKIEASDCSTSSGERGGPGEVCRRRLRWVISQVGVRQKWRFRPHQTLGAVRGRQTFAAGWWFSKSPNVGGCGFAGWGRGAAARLPPNNGRLPKQGRFLRKGRHGGHWLSGARVVFWSRLGFF